MITGELKSKVDKLWDAFWSGGISNPLEIIEQITYLLFIRRLDELHTREEKKANRLGRKIENAIFPSGEEGQRLRWSRFKNLSPQEMFDAVSIKVFPFIKDLRSEVEHSTYSHHMKDARFTIPTPGLLSKVVELVDEIPMEDRDTKGDVYEYMLGKIASAGQNGQFRTPRHIIKMIIELVSPKPTDLICDPACGTAGFLVAASEYLQSAYPEIRTDKSLIKHFHEKMFNGFDFDKTMLRIASMNMLLHGVENPHIIYKDSLSEEHASEEEHYTLILANPPFAGSLDSESCANDLLQIVRTKKTELLFVALFLRLLKPGGRAAVIVPDGVLFGSSNAHKALRKHLIEHHKLEAVIAMPGGVFKPYSGVSTAVLIFTKTNSGGTKNVWFYDMKADGYSLDDRRLRLDLDNHNDNNIPDIIERWKKINSETQRTKREQSFFVSAQEIAGQNYSLSIKKYQEFVKEKSTFISPKVLVKQFSDNFAEIEREIVKLNAQSEFCALLSKRDQAASLTLQDYAEIVMGQSPPGTSYNAEGNGIPLLNGPTEFGDKHPIEKQWTTAPTKLSKTGDILFCVRGATAGRLNIGDKEYCLGRGVAAIRPKRADDLEFLYLILKSYYPYFQAKGVGSTFINISKDDLAVVSIPDMNADAIDELKQFSTSADYLREKLKESLNSIDEITRVVTEVVLQQPDLKEDAKELCQTSHS